MGQLGRLGCLGVRQDEVSWSLNGTGGEMGMSQRDRWRDGRVIKRESWACL